MAGNFSSFRKPAVASHGPPPESQVSRSELFRKLSDTIPPFEILPFPRVDENGEPIGRYRLQVLRQKSIDDAIVEAERYIRRRINERGKDGDDNNQPNQEAWREAYQSALMVELVFRAARTEEDASVPLFTSPEDIRAELSQSEIVHIANSYEQLSRRFGPSFRVLTEDEVEEWIAALMRGGELDLGPLGCLSPGGLVQLVGGLVCLLLNSPTGSSYAGSPSSGSASDTDTTNHPADSGWTPDPVQPDAQS